MHTHPHLGRIVAACLVALLLATASAWSAQVRRLCDIADAMGMQCTIEFAGEVRPGDAQRLRTLLTSDKTRTGSDRFLMLNSAGGDIREALKVAEIVKAAMLTTTLVRHADLEGDERNKRQCVSACFLIFLAGADRKVFWGRLGVHRPYFDPNVYRTSDPLKVAQAQLELEEAVRRYSRAHGVGDQLIGKMMSHSSRDVYWLSPEETEELTGEQSWFQEIMIAGCNHDPSREAAIYNRWAAGAEKLPSERAWLSVIYTCINDRIAKAQRTLN